MGESGKRDRSQKDHGGDNRNQRRRMNGKDEKRDGELVVYRILCPDGVIGSVIGKNGKVINSIRQETRAKVKVVDPFPGSKNRVITIYCYVKEKEDLRDDDEFKRHDPLCHAQHALLKVYSAISNAVAATGSDSEKKSKDKEECQLLVPSSQSANIIGKSGMTIKKLRGKTRANIRVISKDASDPTHCCAMDFDNFVQIIGEPEAIKRALFAISTIMYKFSPKEEIPLETTIQEAPASIIIPPDVPVYPTGGLFSGADSIVPSRSLQPILRHAHVPEIQSFGDTAGTWPVYASTVPLVPGFDDVSRSEELIIRVLCPFDKIGRVIGKGGGTIKSIRQASGSNIEVDDTKVDRDECLITVTSRESPDDLKSMAVETVLLLQGKINDEDDDTARLRLLVPSKVIGCIIGKGGSIVSEIRKRTKADVHISKGNKPKCAGANDELVEVFGEVSNVRDALIQIILRLRDDVLKEKDNGHNSSVITEPLYSGGSGLSVPSLLSAVPPSASLGYDQRVESGSRLGLLSPSSSSLRGYGSLSTREKGYGGSSYSSSILYEELNQSSAREMLVPANAVGKVLGKGGANLVNIRKISGAMVEIFDVKNLRGDRIARISGTPEQQRSAENLIQAFILAT